MIAIGYDYGTTTSWMAMLKQPGIPPVLRSMKSALYINHRDNEIKFEEGAQQNMNDEGVYIKSPKRFIVEKKQGEFKDHFYYSLNEILSDFTTRIIQKVDSQSGQDENEEVYVTVTIPNSYDGAQMRFMRECIQKVFEKRYPKGNVHFMLLPEPIAAALYYAHATLNNRISSERRLYVVTCDMGGGTTDLSVIRLDYTSVENTELFDVTFKVEATVSDAKLGGDHIDNLLFDYLSKKILGSENMLANENQTRKQVTQAKERLSDGTVKLAKVYFSYDSIVNSCLDLSRTVLEERLRSAINRDKSRPVNSSLATLIAELKKKVANVYRDNNEEMFKWEDVVLLPVGGSMHIPELRNIFKINFPGARICELSTEQDKVYSSVVYGAMHHSAIMMNMDPHIRSIKIDGRVCMPISVKYLNNRLYQLVDANMPDGSYTSKDLRPVCIEENGFFRVGQLQFFLRDARTVDADEIPDCCVNVEGDFMANGRHEDNIPIGVTIDVKNSSITKVTVSIENIDAKGGDFYQEYIINQ